MTISAETSINPRSTLRRALTWLRDFDEALNADPVDQTIDQLNRKIEALEARVRKLQS